MTEEEEKERDKWLENNLKALPMEIRDFLDIGTLGLASKEEKELFKAVLREEVKRKYKVYDDWFKKK